MDVGIEKINVYLGPCQIAVKDIFYGRKLNIDRFSNLLLEKKSVGFPFEDAVTNGVNAALPIIEQLTDSKRKQIKMVITASESGIDFGKSLSTYMHGFLGLDNDCRMFEIKQACYSMTAALQMALNHVKIFSDEKVLIIGTDIARSGPEVGYGEPSQGCGSVAILVGTDCKILKVDFGAYGNHSFDVLDSFRPNSAEEMGNSDLSLISYLECLEYCFDKYKGKIEDVNIKDTFDYMLFHTPFGGLVKGAHRRLVGRETNWNRSQIEEDFKKRVESSLFFCKQAGNLYCSSLYLALCGLLANISIQGEKRISLFSYGSGCSSEFFSGVISDESVNKVKNLNIQERLNSRYRLTFEEYKNLLVENNKTIFGIKDFEMNYSNYMEIFKRVNKNNKVLYINKISNYQREYKWLEG